MAVVKNVEINVSGSSNRADLNAPASQDDPVRAADHPQRHLHHQSTKATPAANQQKPFLSRSTKPPPPSNTDQSFPINLMVQQPMITAQQSSTNGQPATLNQKPPTQMNNSILQQHHTINDNGLPDWNHSNNSNNHHHCRHHHYMNGGTGVDTRMNSGVNDSGFDDDAEDWFKRDMRDLEEMLSKWKPMAEKFVPQ